MILTKQVEIKPSGKSIQYYRDLGYDAKYHEPLIVRVVDLPKSSHAEIDVLCSMCQTNIIHTTYDNYNRRIEESGSYVCKECVYEKQRQTVLSKYNVDNYAKTKECHEKMKYSMKNKYGVEHNSQLPDYKEKYHNTCTERYGENYYKYFAEKAFNTFYKKTGYNNPSQSPEVRELMIQSCINHYGVDNPLKSPEVREKITQTFYVNSSQKASKQQRYINNLYQGILNFPIKYYNADIYLSDDNLVVEYDGGFHLGNVITGRETIEEFNQKEIIRNNVVKREGYKQMKIVSSKDLLPSDQILLQMLSDARTYFSDYPNHSWIEFNIDTSTMFNAENKQGTPYDFGTLRTIKDDDINNFETTKEAI